MLAEIPSAASVVRLYPAGLNFCECYLLAEALRQNCDPKDEIEITANDATRNRPVQAIDVDFIHKLTANREGAGAKISAPAKAIYFALHHANVVAVLAGPHPFMKLAIPFPEDVWDAYFQQMMWANEPDAYDIVIGEYRPWLRRMRPFSADMSDK